MNTASYDAQRPIIIVGMHRSGTTLVSELLQDAGVHIGADLEKNAESRFFLNINRWLLRQAGGRWDQPAAMSAVLDQPGLHEPFVESMRRLLTSARAWNYLGLRRVLRGERLPGLAGDWGWKDPRNTWTLPLWLTLFPEAKLVWVTRHGVDVASSLHTRNRSILQQHLPLKRSDLIHFRSRKNQIAKVRSGLSPACATMSGAFDLWLSYMRAGEQHLAQAKQVHRVCYEELLTEPARVMDGLLGFCGLSPASKASSDFDQINASRCYAYRQDDALRRLAEQRRDDLQAFGYDA